MINRQEIFNIIKHGLLFQNQNESRQGTIDILGNGHDKRFIINMYVQRKPGKPDGYSKLDQNHDRLIWLKLCLDEISRIKNINTIAFPEGMGCRLAGGLWSDVLPILEEFADKIYKEQSAETYLYKYSDSEVLGPDLFKGII